MADFICPERNKNSADRKPRGRALEDCASFEGEVPPNSPVGWRTIPSSSGVATTPVYGPEILSGMLERTQSGTRTYDPITGPPKGLPVSKWPLKEKFAEVLRRTGPKLPGEMKNQFLALLTPVNLAIMAGTLAAWAGSHFFGVGEIIDILLLIVGAVFLGMAVFTAAKDLWLFAKGTVDAQTEDDLDKAATKLAEAIAIIGVAAFIALLAKLGGKLAKGAPKEETPPLAPKKPPEIEKPPEAAKPSEPVEPEKPRGISDDLYQRLREKTPSRAIQKMVNRGQVFPQPDPALPGLTIEGPLQADHIVPMKTITEMPGFNELREENMLKVLNNQDNFVGLSEAANKSKGALSFEEWTEYKKLDIPVDEGFRQSMIAREQQLIPQLQAQIQQLLAAQGGPKP